MYAEKKIFDLLELFGDNLLTDIDESLTKKGFGTKAVGATQSTKIIGTSTFKIKPTDDSISLAFYMNDYWYYLEHGRGPTKSGKGKKPFGKTLAGKLFKDGWDVGKGIDAKKWYLNRKDKDGKLLLKNPGKSKILKNYQGLRKLLCQAIARGIHQKGTIQRFGYKGSHFLSEVLNDGRFEKLSEELSKLIGDRIVIDITESFVKGTVKL